jgi:hypothetical protein
MSKPLDHWKWNGPTFASWREAVNKRLHNVYMITIEDAGIEEADLTSHWKTKESPYDYVEWFALKYDLDPITSFGDQLRNR